MMVCFLKSIKLQMLYAHYFRTINCNGVQSLDYMIFVEVEQGEVRPYKNTNLQCCRPPILRTVQEYLGAPDKVRHNTCDKARPLSQA
jgi:hypothetical protein